MRVDDTMLLMMALFIVVLGSMSQDSLNDGDDRIDAKVDWDLLNFDKNRRITKIRVEIQSNQDVPWRKGILEHDEKQFLIELNEQSNELSLVQKLLNPYGRLKMATNDDAVHAGPYVISGRIEIETSTDEHFFIGISDAGFTLDSNSPNSRTLFHCWGLAKVLDELISKKQGSGFKIKQFQVLSGESTILHQKKIFEDNK